MLSSCYIFIQTLNRLFGSTGYCAACNKVIPAFEMVMRARTNGWEKRLHPAGAGGAQGAALATPAQLARNPAAVQSVAAPRCAC